jgi:hypothetical protein
MTKRSSLSFTSPRLRGEVDARSASVEGDSPYIVLVEAPPYPDPLPASGEREHTAAADQFETLLST